MGGSKIQIYKSLIILYIGTSFVMGTSKMVTNLHVLICMSMMLIMSKFILEIGLLILATHHATLDHDNLCISNEYKGQINSWFVTVTVCLLNMLASPLYQFCIGNSL